MEGDRLKIFIRFEFVDSIGIVWKKDGYRLPDTMSETRRSTYWLPHSRRKLRPRKQTGLHFFAAYNKLIKDRTWQRKI